VEISTENYQDLALIGMLIIIALAFGSYILPPAQAALQYYQESPHNNPLELTAKQGDTLYLGKTYDLSMVSGITHKYAFWSNWKEANTNCNPSKIMDVRYYANHTNDTAVFLDPLTWEAGDWYYWDETDCTITHYERGTGIVIANAPLSHDNKFAFTIIKPLANIPNWNPQTFFPTEKYISAYS
jgi:hypothetical protein